MLEGKKKLGKKVRDKYFIESDCRWVEESGKKELVKI